MKKITTLFALLTLFAFGAMSQSVIVFGQIDSARLTTAGGLSGNTPVDSGKLVQVTGLVYGPNSYPTDNGMSFWLNDGTAGIKIYSKHKYGWYATNPLVTGDSVTVVGTLTDYYGSAEIDLFDTVAQDTIIWYSTVTPDTPIVLNFSSFSTQTYGTLVEVKNVDMTAATGWGSTTKHYFTANAGGVYLYVDSFTNDTLFHEAQPQGIYDVIGIADDYSTTQFNLDPRYTTDFILVGSTTGINSIDNLLTAAVYPNPANTQVTVSFGSEIEQTVSSKMFDVTGREVLADNSNAVAGNNTIHLNTSNLSNGLYVLEVRLGEKTLNTKINIIK